MIRTLLAVLALASLFSSHALAGSTCPEHFLGGQSPALAVPAGAVELCSDTFATLWSPETRDPVYSAEHLTPAALIGADKTARLNAFHADDRLPRSVRAELSDYAGGAFDRGHMAPAHDMPTPEAMRQSFVLSNMVPQNPANNRGVWAHVEEFTRRLVVLAKEAYVVTGPIFEGAPKRLNGRVAIPFRIWKAVYVPPSQFNPDGQVGAYVVANTAEAVPEIISLDGLKALTGIDAFPVLSDRDRARADLPAVAPR
ncbi:DNA/RNA non-specific endonuclease [Methylobacterium sp. E-046]|uniref:DNA/RNA non-specific endonuclease n=1 Tax=Methylobacterium sp. E-046 TaxID=2836576 RepID=UPI001FBB7781|nr:DNA/RNA non-specific endonuclease [Methylobacterium sp. E-046]MCJ2098926.1 DNA/RNA non-specific endonuclease [Methylobacterium sp. E-046]